jgi:hypothetical protein
VNQKNARKYENEFKTNFTENNETIWQIFFPESSCKSFLNVEMLREKARGMIKQSDADLETFRVYENNIAIFICGV